ncbi:MAG: type II toxin-antitoxin system VapC family toxin [Caldilineaceae bacterium]
MNPVGASPCGRPQGDAPTGLGILFFGTALAEFVALATARRLPRSSVLEYLDALTAHPDIELIWIDEQLHREAFALLLARRDKEYSLCDAVSFVLMRQRNIIQALTTDKHFEQEGFIRLLK